MTTPFLPSARRVACRFLPARSAGAGPFAFSRPFTTLTIRRGLPIGAPTC